MYSNFSKFCLLVTLFIVIGGCDFMNVDQNDFYTKEDTFNDFTRTKNFLSNIYSRLPGGFNSVGGAMRASASDNAEEIYSAQRVQDFNNGSWSPTNLLDNHWGSSYEAIREANTFLNNFNIDNFSDRKFNDDYEQQMEQAHLFSYQTRFLRAFFYFELIKRYGDVPLVTDVVDIDKVNNIAPSSLEDVVDFIVSECDAIIPELPLSYTSVPGNETGRATRGAAMALKSRVLLYAASPLHNPNDESEPWQATAEAAKAIIDSSYYSLEGNYSNVVNNRTSNELIFGRRHSASNSFERSNFPVGYEGSSPGTAPTQNLVDAYEMQNTGLGINQSGSGYDPDHPYQGRDPRLYKTVIVNNSNWKNRDVEIWDGGRDGPPQSRATVTGYYLKKQVIEDVSLDPNNTTSAIHTWNYFRYGGILLDYAEAMNEAYGPDNGAGMGMTARQAVNKVRERVNMPGFPAGMTKNGFREKLHNERRVELAFEDKRFWDIRRWKIGPSTTNIYGMEITKNNDGSFDYDKQMIENRVWQDRMYFYPIPPNEIFVNDNLSQNPGW